MRSASKFSMGFGEIVFQRREDLGWGSKKDLRLRERKHLRGIFSLLIEGRKNSGNKQSEVTR